MSRAIMGYVCLLLSVCLVCCKQHGEPTQVDAGGGIEHVGATPSDSPQIESFKRLGVGGQAVEDLRRLQEKVRGRTYDGDRADNDFFYAGLEEPQVAEFLKVLKDAVAGNDRRKVASLVQYPTMVTLNGRGEPVSINSADEFVAKYDAIMNDRVLSAIRKAEIANLRANWQGVSMGRGAVWFGGLCANGELKGCSEFVMRITKINNRPLPGTDTAAEASSNEGRQ